VGSQAPLGKKDLFNTPGVELPGYIREVARALMRDGKDKSKAIQIAIGVVKNWAEGKGKGVNADTRAKAAAAVAQWEKAKATARATPNKADLSNDVTPDFSRSGMIALEVPAGAITPVPGGLAAEDMHVTLQYLGEDVSDPDFAKAIRRAFSATEVGPVAGYVGGLGVFPAEDGKVPVWCPVDVPGVTRLHDYVSGGPSASDHGFTPHITLAWAEEGKPLPAPVPKTPVTFTHIIVKRGTQTIRLPLVGLGRDEGERPEQAYSNPVYAPGRTVLLAQAPEPNSAPKKKTAKKPPPKTAKEGQRFKHGWIPVDENGKPTGPAQKPEWLKKAEAAHKAAGGRTADQIQAEKASNEFKARAKKAAAPAKKAAAEAKRKKAEALRNAKKKETAKKSAAHKAEVAANAKKRAEDHKAKERTALVSRAYKLALADRKAGKTLSDTQRRVIAHVEAQQKKDEARLRKVDVKGADGSKVAAKAPVKKTAVKKAAAQKAVKGAITTATTVKQPVKVAMRSMKNRDRRTRTGVKSFANDDDVNALDFAGSHFPGGQLAFRYKHGWILINPAIPSRGIGGGGLARKHGHKSGTVTHGHFAPHPSGKGKVFVPDRTGGKTAAQKIAEVKAKNAIPKTPAKINYKKSPADKSKFGLVAAQEGPKSSVAAKPTPAHVQKIHDEAVAAQMKAETSGTAADAQVAAKKHADAFVQAKKIGNNQLAYNHKAVAQKFAKKAAELKAKEKADTEKAEKAKKEAADKAEAEKKAKADAEQKAKEDAQDLSSDAFAAGMKAEDEDTAAAHNAAAAAHKKAADAFQGTGDIASKNLHEQEVLAHAKAAKSYEKKAAAPKVEPKPEPELGPGMTKAKKLEGLGDHIYDTLDEIDLQDASAAQWDDYLHASAKYKVDPSPANLKKLAAEQKKLMNSGATSSNITEANTKLFSKMGLTDKPKKKTVAEKKAAAPVKKAAAPAPKKNDPSVFKSEYVSAYNDLIAEGKTESAAELKAKAISKGIATEADFKTPAVPTITLPGPGMYADGNAIMKGKKKADAMPDGPAKDAQLEAVSNAMQAFKAKHNKTFDINAVEDMGGTFVPQSSNLATHPAYADAVAAGFTPVNTSTSANGDWKPSQVKGLKSTGGAYHYSGGSYTVINQQLRKHKKATGGSNDAAIAQMDKEFAAVPPLAEGIVTTRRMGTRGPFPEIPPPMEPGAVFQDHGYSSTSKDPGVWSGNVVMQIRIPAGAKVLDLNHTTGSQHSSEQEILLNRGSKYRVVSDSKKAGERKIVVELVTE
jgi:hypothetical protein